jgi:Outer membrane protein beta-barrel domain
MNEMDHIPDMEQLANAGWNQMQVLLKEHGLAKVPVPVNKFSVYQLIAATLLCLLFLTLPFLVNNRLNVATAIEVPSSQQAVGIKTDVTKTVKMITPVSHPAMLSKVQTSGRYGKTIYIDSKKVNFTITLVQPAAITLQQAASQRLSPIAQYQKTIEQQNPDSSQSLHSVSKTKNTSAISKKIQVYAGAGLNISAWNQDPQPFGLKDVNVHPGISLVLPLSKRFALHSGLWAFSTVHGKEARAKEREFVNNLSNNIYYNVNTTSIVKASYFDVPLTVHYSLNDRWTVGSGLQVSKLYKMNIREEQQSFDYNNTLFAASVQEYNRTPSRAAISLQKKAEIKNWETRLVAESRFKQGKWLFSAGYYYGLGKTITLKESNSVNHEYRNEYLKLAVQFQIK